MRTSYEKLSNRLDSFHTMGLLMLHIFTTRRLAPPALLKQVDAEKILATNDRVFNDARVRDHFAVIPTGMICLHTLAHTTVHSHSHTHTYPYHMRH